MVLSIAPAVASTSVSYVRLTSRLARCLHIIKVQKLHTLSEPRFRALLTERDSKVTLGKRLRARGCSQSRVQTTTAALQRAAITMVAWGRLLPTESETMRRVR
jgi:hypothetical protein